jgi:hypothetical protein
VLDAETEGMLGYLLQQELANLLPATRAVASLLTRVEVDPLDPAFLTPTKPIGPVNSKAQADELARRRHWAMAAEGTGWQRVVPSHRPVRVMGLEVIRGLLQSTRSTWTGVCRRSRPSVAPRPLCWRSTPLPQVRWRPRSKQPAASYGPAEGALPSVHSATSKPCWRVTVERRSWPNRRDLLHP